MNEKRFEFNENFDQVYFLLNKNVRLSIISNLKKIMFEIRQCNDAINRIKSYFKNNDMIYVFIPKFGMAIYKL